ncbi:alcohol dehydrogenase catalytic domain-containing protein [Streptomyces flaveolus]|uniref:alcohol dehydrogenase catalytic domain-containing protein n=1 Tax=Streptomyces flaveolus TaxID=67297 RepID=UPI00343BAC6C
MRADALRNHQRIVAAARDLFAAHAATRRRAARDRGGGACSTCQAPGTAAEFEVVEPDLTKPKRGEVLIKVEATGLCHSELHMLTGDWPVPLPMGGGHGATGIVGEIGPGVGRGRSGTASTVPLFRRPRLQGAQPVPQSTIQRWSAASAQARAGSRE